MRAQQMTASAWCTATPARRLHQLKEHLGTIRIDASPEAAAAKRGSAEIFLGADPEAVPAVGDGKDDDAVQSDAESDAGEA